MKVLIPTLRSDLIGGKETFTRDLALGLERRGHTAVVLAEPHPHAARGMAADGVRVCTDWNDIGFAPDIIHGQHTVDTMVALTRCPDAPAFYQVHGAAAFSSPQPHPRIYRYGTMTGSLANRLSIEMGLPRQSFVVVQNTADLSRFANVREPPARPSKALFYSSYHRPESRTFEAARAAAEQCALEFHCVGRPFGNRIEQPEGFLPGFDLVFACGLSAIEALCCGCAVIVLGMTSCGEMVLPENFERFRAANFTIPFNAVPPSVADIVAAIETYDAMTLRGVTALSRTACDGSRMIGEMIDLYGTILAEHGMAERNEPAERRALAGMLRTWSPVVNLNDRHVTFEPTKWRSALRSIGAQITRMEDR
ncbi:MAG: hypothetical protein KDJ86_04350 [Bauldia sp.]|uniref:hypothetical protein n=1 Tax=Bauldia sp. TaxID=2575872 RepID=UPI001D5CB4E8|nr:hypothetical protein [Bauldia sp.]MCB1494996.1 hypothetical protein [Bauldia sp.]